MSESDEEEIYIVKIRRGQNEEFGSWVSETWFKQSTMEEGRPDGQPSFLRYDPETKETLEMGRSTMFKGKEHLVPEGTFYINRGSIDPCRHVRINHDIVRTFWPNYEADEKTRRLKYENYDNPRHVHDSYIFGKPKFDTPEP